MIKRLGGGDSRLDTAVNRVLRYSFFFAVALGRCGRCLRHLATKGDATKRDLPSNLADHLAACLGNVGSHRVCLSVESLHLVGALLVRCPTWQVLYTSTWQVQLGSSLGRCLTLHLADPAWQFYLAGA